MSKLKEQFSEFYVDKLKKSDLENNLIVLDTNYLLDILKLPVSEAQKYLKALKKVKKNIYIPYFVALEFNFNKIGVKIGTQISIDEYKSNLTSKLDEFGEEINKLEILRTDEFTAPLMDLKESFKKEFLELLEDKVSNYFSYDSVYTELITLIEDSVGEKKDQKWIEAVQEEGISRYEKEIPPGFNDKSKSDITQYDGIEYEKKYGDLLIWKEILEKCKDETKSKIIFVTNDGTSKKKHDILYSTHGRTIGPHIYLINEMKRESGKELHIINNIRFVKLTTDLSSEDLSKLQIAEDYFNKEYYNKLAYESHKIDNELEFQKIINKEVPYSYQKLYQPKNVDYDIRDQDRKLNKIRAKHSNLNEINFDISPKHRDFDIDYDLRVKHIKLNEIVHEKEVILDKISALPIRRYNDEGSIMFDEELSDLKNKYLELGNREEELKSSIIRHENPDFYSRYRKD